MEELHKILSASTLAELYDAETAFLAANSGWEPVFKRYFLNDCALRPEAIRPETGAVSHIGQAPLDGHGAAVWLYLVRGAKVQRTPGLTVVEADGLRHYWTGDGIAAGPDSYAQTERILHDYIDFLASRGLNLPEQCIRTWFFVRDIDDNYAGLVKSRREIFETQGLTPQTHYIASTGINGSPVDPAALVQLDAYAVEGLPEGAQRYLYAPTHLSPTSIYGVTFERGVRVEYSGAAHSIISGTASIDNRGEVLHVGDVVKQSERMIENVGKLLEESGATFSDLKMAIVYLRRPEDYPLVKDRIAELLGTTPYVIVRGPVCRPTWLIEMECIAIRPC
ncbi:MAG: hypothetical protein IKQ76_04800 [Bacteroidales bacterium]|nr:hypothetical protein [Bacteroidales bacterium]